MERNIKKKKGRRKREKTENQIPAPKKNLELSHWHTKEVIDVISGRKDVCHDLKMRNALGTDPPRFHTVSVTGKK
jgi:hypothetical protein